MRKIAIGASLIFSATALALSLVSFFKNNHDIRQPAQSGVTANFEEDHELFRKKLLAHIRASIEMQDNAEWGIWLVLCKQNFHSFGCVKASGFVDRKSVHIDLILTDLRSANRESFHISPKCENFIYRVLGPIKNPIIENRINDVFDYLKAYDGPDIRSEVF